MGRGRIILLGQKEKKMLYTYVQYVRLKELWETFFALQDPKDITFARSFRLVWAQFSLILHVERKKGFANVLSEKSYCVCAQ